MKSVVFMSALIGAALLLPSCSSVKTKLPEKVLETGGLAVVLGYGDGSLTALLSDKTTLRIHVLDPDPDRVLTARTQLMDRGLYGRVTLEKWTGTRLPYASELVNVIIVTGNDLKVEPRELIRVLAPRGIAVLPKVLSAAFQTGYGANGQVPALESQIEGDWFVSKKTVPAEVDSWTHFLHDASGNAVADDRRVGPPKRLQWSAGPDHARHHDALASLSAMVSSEGRLFTIYDEGPVSLIHCRADWQLIARDAYNGIVLWKRPIPDWLTQFYYFRAGPVWLARRLVASGNRVYATLGLTAPISAMDAETGKTIRTYKGTGKTEEFILHENRVLAVVSDPEFVQDRARKLHYWRESRSFEETGRVKMVVACDESNGKVLWEYSDPQLGYLVPSTLCAFGDQVFFLDGQSLLCIGLGDGKVRWQSPFEMKGFFVNNYSATVVATDKAILCLSTKQLAAFDSRSGELLWKQDRGYLGFASPGDLFVVGDTVWALPEIRTSDTFDSPSTEEGNMPVSFRNPSQGLTEFEGVDILTGKVLSSLSKDELLPSGHHHRCYRNKATSRYLITGRRGVEFLGIAGDKHQHHWWIRGECQYGILPCNGLLYRPPDPCACFDDVKYEGFLAFTAENDTIPVTDPEPLMKGPAYGKDPSLPLQEVTKRAAEKGGGLWSTAGIGRNGDWPTYRHDMARSGYGPTVLTEPTQVLWKKQVGKDPGAVTVADGRLFIPDLETNSVYCCNAITGDHEWTYIANGPVDSPPTIWHGAAFFGSRDGYLYAVRVTDGELIWRFHAAPEDRRIVVKGRLESEWPVFGSVLVHDGIVYCTAGRTANLSGGIRVFGLRTSDGAVLHQRTIAEGVQPPVSPDGDRLETGPKGCLSDLLVSDGKMIRMRQMLFDLDLESTGGDPGLLRSTGFLETQAFHRRQWSLGTNRGPWGKLLVFNDTLACGAQSPYAYLRNTLSMWPLSHKGHHHQQFSKYEPGQFPIGTRIYAQNNKSVSKSLKPENTVPKELEAYSRFSNLWKGSTLAHRWTEMRPIQAEAMILAGEVLVVAGWRDAVEVAYGAEPPPEKHPLRQPVLLHLSAADGTVLSEQELPAKPVFDGMAAANGHLYLALQDGQVLCLGSQFSTSE